MFDDDFRLLSSDGVIVLKYKINHAKISSPINLLEYFKIKKRTSVETYTSRKTYCRLVHVKMCHISLIDYDVFPIKYIFIKSNM